MVAHVFPIPSYSGDAVDLVFLDTQQHAAGGLLHYSYAVGASNGNVDERRKLDWTLLQQFREGGYRQRQPETVSRLSLGQGYLPGEMALKAGASANTELNTAIRLGALELLANISSGRLAAGSKDPFPHQLALAQFMRSQPNAARRRILIADEVGLGKTVEAGLILRDLLVAAGSLDDFSCLYLTSGGLVEDAATKLRDTLQGAFGDQRLVESTNSFARYGIGGIRGVYVASTHAARRYVREKKKRDLPDKVAPRILVVDECHHAACNEASGPRARGAQGDITATYQAISQMLSGTFWPNSKPPELVILMSATPFRTKTQFVNLLRLLVHGSRAENGSDFDAYAPDVDDMEILCHLQVPTSGVDIVWRRQNDPEVRTWNKERLFPNLRVIRPHNISGEVDEVLESPGEQFTDLLERITREVRAIAQSNGKTFGGFATAQLSKKLTSSSIAGATTLFARAVRHCAWRTKAEFEADQSEATNELRRLIKKISQRLAEFSKSDTQHADVVFASEGFTFPAKSLARAEIVSHIYDFHKELQEKGEAPYVLKPEEILTHCRLANEILDFGYPGDPARGIRPVENAKNEWLARMLERHPRDKFLVFTESLQTCEIICKRFGDTATRRLVGSMSEGDRDRAVRDLRSNPNVRILVATSAADEGFDLQVANRVVHWDLSSSPATLMQRNGRVARLGQRSDVTAYYLILPGTHEERRDSLLLEKFNELGIDDEVMRNRILGMISDEDLERLESIEQPLETHLVGDLLRQAAQANREMEQNLERIKTRMTATAVLDREQLATRLEKWKQLGLPETGIEVDISTVRWDKPIFGDEAVMVEQQAKTACITRGSDTAKVVFDPEFLVFGPGGDYALAGLRPWLRKEDRHGRLKIRPDCQVDLLGDLLCRLARQPDADLAHLPRKALEQAAPTLATADWLLFCTHPIREAETERQDPLRPCLTAYAFGSEEELAPEPAYATAEQVHALIAALESDLTARNGSGQPEFQPEELRQFGERAARWVQRSCHYFQASFLEEVRRFVPIPVAVVRVVG